MLPHLKYIQNTYTNRIQRFSGLDRREGAGPESCREMENMVTADDPALKTAPRIQAAAWPEWIDDFCPWDEMIRCSGGKLYIGETEVCDVSPGEKQMAIINRQLLIYPDKLVIDLKEKTAEAVEIRQIQDFIWSWERTADGTLEPVVVFTGSRVRDSLVSEEYLEYTGDLDQDEGKNYIWAFSQRPKPENGPGEDKLNYWDMTDAVNQRVKDLKTGEYIPLAVKADLEGTGELVDQLVPWVAVSCSAENPHSPNRDYYGKVTGLVTEADGDFLKVKVRYDIYEYQEKYETEDFKKGDVVRLRFRYTVYESAGTAETSTDYFTIIESQIKEFDGVSLHLAMESWEKLEDAERAEVDGTVTMETKAPDLDFICASENRVWGVNNQDRTVYACALGAPRSWYYYGGTDADSYAVAVAGAGDFTGICGYSGDVLVFKENEIIRFSGSNPSNVYSAQYTMDGLPKGGHRGLTIINDALYYCGKFGLYRWTPSSMENIGAPLGRLEGLNGQVLGSDGETLFFSAWYPDGSKRTLSCNTGTGAWGAYGKKAYQRFGALGVQFYGLGEDGVLYHMKHNEENGAGFAWNLEFNPAKDGTSLQKHYKRVRVEYEMDPGGTAFLEVETSGGVTRSLALRQQKQSMVLILPQARSIWIKVKLHGTGGFILRALERERVTGSDRRNWIETV